MAETEIPRAEVDELASALSVDLGLLVRRLRQSQIGGELTVPETSALARLDRGGPTTATHLAKLEQISPQSMGATLGGLADRGLIERTPDPVDGRRIVVALTEAGTEALGNRRKARAEKLAQALSSGFTTAELRRLAAALPLLERLAEQI